MTTLVDVAAFLLADDGDFVTVETGKSANDRGIIGISSIAVDLDKIGKDGVENIQRIRTVRMTRPLDAFKSGYRHFFFLSK